MSELFVMYNCDDNIITGIEVSRCIIMVESVFQSTNMYICATLLIERCR